MTDAQVTPVAEEPPVTVTAILARIAQALEMIAETLGRSTSYVGNESFAFNVQDWGKP